VCPGPPQDFAPARNVCPPSVHPSAFTWAHAVSHHSLALHQSL
jgi:hypothetical protein